MTVDYERGASEDRLDEVRRVSHRVLCPSAAGEEHGQRVATRNRSPEQEPLKKKTKQNKSWKIWLFYFELAVLTFKQFLDVKIVERKCKETK